MVASDQVTVALRFNECITAGDIDALTDLMSTDHTFVDTENHQVSGRDACREAWSGFFDAFPGYRNTFTSIVVNGNHVAMAGFSTSSEPALSGPALWTATTDDDRVLQWRVYDDTPDNRALLGFVEQ